MHDPVVRETGQRDHVAGVVRDPTANNVHGVSWGSRTFYTWTARGEEHGSSANPSHLLLTAAKAQARCRRR